MPAGRPSQYSDSIRQEVINLMAEGLSLTAAMAELGFHRDTAYEWQSKHPEFSDAVKLGQAKRQLFLERRLMGAEIGAVVTSSIFALKNTGTGDWRDKQEMEHTGDLSIKHSAAELSDEELAALVAKGM